MKDRAVLLLRRRRPIGEPPELEPGATPGYTTLASAAGAGRVRLALAELGISTRTLRQAVLEPAVTPSDLAALDVGRRYALVILGSHLVNTPDEPLRHALLAVARRHLVDEGDLLVEHHPIDWTETAAPTAPTPGSTVGMEDVRVHPPFVSAVSTYDVGGRYERVPFTARVLSEAELDAALATAGLRRRRRLGPTWLLAGRPDG
jgi:hypothetical protein